MLKILNAIFIAMLLAVGVSGCQKQTETQTPATSPEGSTLEGSTTEPAPSTTPASAPAAEKHTSTTPAHSTSREGPNVVVVPQQQKSNNTVGQAAVIHRAVAAPLRRAIGAEKYIQNHPSGE
jgi:hypothetical protein